MSTKNRLVDDYYQPARENGDPRSKGYRTVEIEESRGMNCFPAILILGVFAIIVFGMLLSLGVIIWQ